MVGKTVKNPQQNPTAALSHWGLKTKIYILFD